jgi:hypothetical protein
MTSISTFLILFSYFKRILKVLSLYTGFDLSPLWDIEEVDLQKDQFVKLIREKEELVEQKIKAEIMLEKVKAEKEGLLNSIQSFNLASLL